MPKESKFSEEEFKSLIRGLLNGDERAAEKFFDVFANALFPWFNGSGVQAADAGELVDDTLMNVLKRLKSGAVSFRDQQHLQGYIFSEGRGRIIDYWRRVTRRQGKTEGEEVLEQSASAADGPLESLLRSSDRARVREALTHLKDIHRIAVELRYLQGCSYEEIAEKEKISIVNAKVRVTRGGQELLEILKKNM